MQEEEDVRRHNVAQRAAGNGAGAAAVCWTILRTNIMQGMQGVLIACAKATIMTALRRPPHRRHRRLKGPPEGTCAATSRRLPMLRILNTAISATEERKTETTT